MKGTPGKTDYFPLMESLVLLVDIVVNNIERIFKVIFTTL